MQLKQIQECSINVLAVEMARVQKTPGTQLFNNGS